MKKVIAFVSALFCLLGLIACQREEDVLHLGLNAEIIEIDIENHLLYVKGVDENSNKVFGNKAPVDCQSIIEREKIFYVDYSEESNTEVEIIQFKDLQVGDMITIGIYESEFSKSGPMNAEQLQLATQRINED